MFYKKLHDVLHMYTEVIRLPRTLIKIWIIKAWFLLFHPPRKVTIIKELIVQKYHLSFNEFLYRLYSNLCSFAVDITTHFCCAKMINALYLFVSRRSETHNLKSTHCLVPGMEIVGPSKRTFAGIAIQIIWCIGELLLLLCAYFIREWRYLELAFAVPSIGLLFYWWSVTHFFFFLHAICIKEFIVCRVILFIF